MTDEEVVPTMANNNGDDDLLPVPTRADKDRLDAVWKGLADVEHVQVNPQNRMDLWAIEHQVRANRLSTASLARASRALVWVTVGLVIVTLGQLVLAILDHKW
jgi:hypothetical protein